MSARVEFNLTDEEYDAILTASKSVPYLVAGGTEPSSPQENANRAWQALASKHGFIWNTVRPGKDKMHFTAEATR